MTAVLHAYIQLDGLPPPPQTIITATASMYPLPYHMCAVCTHIATAAEGDGAVLEPVQLVQRVMHRHVADEVVHLVILACRHRLVGHQGLGPGKAVVGCAYAVAVADGQACVEGRECRGAGSV